MKAILLALFIVSLIGCTPGNVRTDQDTIGDLGAEKKQSPADVYVKLGIAYLRQGDFRSALLKLKKGLEADPDSADAHNAIGLVYLRLGEDKVAGSHFERAVELKPKNPFFRNALGTYLCGQGEYDRALKQFDIAIANPLYPTPEIALNNAGLCSRRKGDLERADGYFRKVLQRNPNNPSALLEMARISFATGRTLSARAYLQRYEAVAKPTAESLWIGVRTERKLGAARAARRYARMLKSRFPDSDQAKQLEE